MRAAALLLLLAGCAAPDYGGLTGTIDPFFCGWQKIRDPLPDQDLIPPGACVMVIATTEKTTLADYDATECDARYLPSCVVALNIADVRLYTVRENSRALVRTVFDFPVDGVCPLDCNQRSLTE